MNRRLRILAGLTALGVAGFALSLWTGRTDAGADKIAFPATYKDGVIYQVAETDVLLKGQSASLTFKDPGVYSYNCALHPNMKGAVEVKK